MEEEKANFEPELTEKVKRVIAKDVRPLLALESGNIELVGVEEGGVVNVRLGGACAGCLMAQYTLVNFVEGTIKKKVPEIKRVKAVEDFRDRFGIRKIW